MLTSVKTAATRTATTRIYATRTVTGIATRQIAVLRAFMVQDKTNSGTGIISLTVAEIATITGLTRRAAQAGAAGLMRRGLLVRLQTGLYAMAAQDQSETHTAAENAQSSGNPPGGTPPARHSRQWSGQTSHDQASGNRLEPEPSDLSISGICMSYLCLGSGPQRSFTGIRRVKKPTMKDRYWQMMRLKPVFTLMDLVMASGSKSTDDRRAYANAMRFTNQLHQAGLVRKLPHRTPGYSLTSNGYCRYQLLQDLGPEAPVIRQAKGTLYDPNSQTHHPLRRP